MAGGPRLGKRFLSAGMKMENSACRVISIQVTGKTAGAAHGAASIFPCAMATMAQSSSSLGIVPPCSQACNGVQISAAAMNSHSASDKILRHEKNSFARAAVKLEFSGAHSCFDQSNSCPKTGVAICALSSLQIAPLRELAPGLIVGLEMFDEDGHGETRQQRDRQLEAVVRMELQFRQQVGCWRCKETSRRKTPARSPAPRRWYPQNGLRQNKTTPRRADSPARTSRSGVPGKL